MGRIAREFIGPSLMKAPRRPPAANAMFYWKCSFCGKIDHQEMVHTTCIIPGKHLYFCNPCFREFEGRKESKNPKILKLRDSVAGKHYSE